MSNAVRCVFIAVAVLAAAGIVVSSLSLYHHFSKSKTTYCDIGENFNCDIVNRSIYSTVLGIPDALIGIVGYGFLLLMATRYRSSRQATTVLLLSAVAGLSFALYLTYVEAFVLATWCILCLSSLSLITLITACSSFLFVSSMRRA